MANRFLEICPGLLTWLSLILPIILAFFAPIIVASFFVVYAIYWLIKCLIMAGHLITGYVYYRREIVIDWPQKLRQNFPKEYPRIHHVLIMPTYKEPIAVVDRAIKKIIASNYDLKKVIFVLATEERAGEFGREKASELSKMFARRFGEFIVSQHPANLAGEIAGKGANITYAGKRVAEYISQQKIKPNNVIVTTLDCDNQTHPQYLACLTYKYLDDTDPKHKSFQPLPMYFNNIWEVPVAMRMIALGSSFWQMVESTRPTRLRNFSAHAQSLAALIEVNFWSTTTIVEDGHQFWRTYFYYHGQHNVIPIFVPIYQDAVLAHNYWQTLREQYLQKKRWAWGVSDIPYVIINTIKDRRAPFIHKWVQVFRLIEGHWSWATTSIYLAILGWLPFVANRGFRTTVWAYNFPFVYSRILGGAMLGMIVTLVISTFLLPPRGKVYPLRIALEWLAAPLLLPLTNIIFGSLPAIDSQTRLMLGKYLEYRVTVKK